MNGTKSKGHFFILALSILSLATLAVYSNILSAPFMIDDRMYIVENYKIRALSSLWPPYGTRYFGYLSFALNYRFGGLNPFGYHLTNVLIHIGSAILLYQLVVQTFDTPWMEDAGMKGNRGGAIALALATSLLFALHPVQTEAVTYITQRFASLAAFFYLLSLLLYARWRTTAGAEGGRSSLYVLSLVSAVFAQMSKEISFTLPFVIVLYELVFFREKEARLKPLIPFLLTLAIIPFTMLAPRLGINITGPGIDEKIMAAQVKELFTLSRHDYLLTQFKVLVTYLRILVLPVNQNWAYDYPVSRSVFEARVLLSFFFLLMVFASAAYLFLRARSKKNAYLLLASCGVFWFFITISIESSIIPIKDVIFEHRLYLPGAGAALAFSSLAFLGFERLRKTPARLSLAAFAIVLMLVTSVPLAAASYLRNNTWSDLLTFYEDVVKKSPNIATPRYDLAMVYKKLGRIDEAIDQYRAAILLKPDYFEAHNNLGNAYLEKGMVDEAASEYRAALRINPQDAEAYFNLGNLYYNQSMFNEAAGVLTEAIRLDPRHIDAHNTLGNSYLKTGQTDRAAAEYKKVLEIDPDYVHAHSNMGNIHLLKGQLVEAVQEYKKAIALKPDYMGAHYNLGVAYFALNRVDDAIDEYRKAIELKPDYGDAHFKLAVAYYSKKDLASAVMELRTALRLDPEDMKAHLTLANVLSEKGETDEALEHYKYFIDYAPEKYKKEAGEAKAAVKALKARGR